MKSVLIIMSVLTFIASLFGCSKPSVRDGDGMVYVDSDYRTEYANALDFDSQDGTPFFAVAFLGSGEEGEKSANEAINSLFGTLTKTSTEKIEHLDLGGNDYYLVVPRYKDYVDVINTDTNEKHTLYHGEAFTIRCAVNAEICISSRGGHKYIPSIDSGGKLTSSTDVWDITEYE